MLTPFERIGVVLLICARAMQAIIGLNAEGIQAEIEDKV
jgi:hypothetical protein